MTTDASERDPPIRAVAVGAAISVLLSLLIVTSGLGMAAAANSTPTPSPIEEKAPYYENDTRGVNASYWFEHENASLVGITDMFARVPSVVIGTGQQERSGSGFEGVLITGLVVAGAALATNLRTRSGPVGGLVIGLVVSYGLTEVALIPMWVQPLILLALGLVVSVAAIRVVRA